MSTCYTRTPQPLCHAGLPRRWPCHRHVQARSSSAAVARLRPSLPPPCRRQEAAPSTVSICTARRTLLQRTAASPTGTGGGGGGNDNPTDWTIVTRIGLFALWVAVLGYVFTLSPNQTPYRDQYYLEKLIGISKSEGVNINSIFFYVFNVMGVYPAIYAALIQPAGKSRNNIPAAPFLALSFAGGVYALLPYFALWEPLPQSEQQPLPPKSELGIFRKFLESPIIAGLLLAASVYLVGGAAIAGGDAWKGYLQLFDESRFVHVTSIDFLLLTAFVPFWISNDAEYRDFKYKDQVILFALLPVIGPALYLLLRPKSE